MRKSLNTMIRWIEDHAGFKTYALVLLFVMAIAYNYQVWRLGIYYDDWEGIFLYKQGFSASQIWDYFLRDRPFSSLIHILFNPIIGASSIGWHILGLLLNWGAIVFLVKTILHLWPNRVMEAGWIGLFMGVYPGMQRQFVVHTSAPHYTSMFLFCLSVYLMVKAIDGNKHRHILLGISIFLAAAQVLFIEYFTGLELIRPLIIYYAYKRTGKTNAQALKASLLMYIPFAVVFAGFLVYKFEILPAMQLADSKRPKHGIELFDTLRDSPLEAISNYTQIILRDALHSMFYAWTLSIAPDDINLQSKLFLFSWVTGGVLALISSLFVAKWQEKVQPEKQSTSNWRFILLLCITAFLLGGLPAWIIGRQATDGIWGDRFLFGQIFGTIPLTTLVLVWLIGLERRHVQNIVFAILLASAVSWQMRTANSFVLTWNLERSYYWQLKWRVPSLKEGAFILSPYTPFFRNSHYQIAFGVNVIYGNPNGDESVPVWWFDGPSGLFDSKLGQYPPQPVQVKFRSLTFTSDMNHALPVVHREGRGCLQVLDPIYEGEPHLTEQEKQLFPVINPGLVMTEERSMPIDVFGQEPPREWCYYYQKADLARSFGQWDEVIRLWNEAKQNNFQAGYGPEYLPFIEAFAEQGDWETAGRITLQAYETTQEAGPLLCRNWERIRQNTPDSPEKRSAKEWIQTEMTCNPG